LEGGTGKEIEAIIKEFRFPWSDWYGLMQWILKATLLSSDEALSQFHNENIADFWRQEHSSVQEQAIKWFKKNLEEVKTHAGASNIHVRLAGGGLLDAKLTQRVKEVIPSVIPGAKITITTYSDSS
jgi:hypothetical protein